MMSNLPVDVRVWFVKMSFHKQPSYRHRGNAPRSLKTRQLLLHNTKLKLYITERSTENTLSISPWYLNMKAKSTIPMTLIVRRIINRSRKWRNGVKISSRRRIVCCNYNLVEERSYYRFTPLNCLYANYFWNSGRNPLRLHILIGNDSLRCFDTIWRAALS